MYNWINIYENVSNEGVVIISRKISTIARKSRKLTSECEAFIIDHVKKNPTFNMKKLAKKITRKYNIHFNNKYIYHILKKHNITHKKVQKITYPYGKTKFKKATKELKKVIDKCDNNFTAIDETAVYLGTSSNYGWSKQGVRCPVKSTFNRKNKYSLCQAISKNGIVASKMIKGSFNTIKFNEFVISDVMPNMPNNTLLMDGCVIHKSKELAKELEEKNITKIINVPYSPQFNPIEYTFNTLKSLIKKNNVNTLTELTKTLDKHSKDANKKGFTKYYDHTYKNINSVLNNNG
jgi:transposase